MKLRSMAVALLTLAVICTASAQTAAPDPHAKVRRLLELTGAANLGLQMIDGMIDTFKGSAPNVPEEFWTNFRAKVKADSLIEMVIPVYEKHLTDEDLDALIAFYSSPAGRRFVEKQPLILADSMKIGEEWGEKMANEVIQELQKKGYGSKTD